jgi:hypothetical protein
MVRVDYCGLRATRRDDRPPDAANAAAADPARDSGAIQRHKHLKVASVTTSLETAASEAAA